MRANPRAAHGSPGTITSLRTSGPPAGQQPVYRDASEIRSSKAMLPQNRPALRSGPASEASRCAPGVRREEASSRTRSADETTSRPRGSKQTRSLTRTGREANAGSSTAVEGCIAILAENGSHTNTGSTAGAHCSSTGAAPGADTPASTSACPGTGPRASPPASTCASASARTCTSSRAPALCPAATGPFEVINRCRELPRGSGKPSRIANFYRFAGKLNRTDISVLTSVAWPLIL